MRRLAASLLGLAGLLASGAQAQTSAPPTGWDGANPFRCTLQQAGFLATVPDPAADPYCVEFDKRRQNVTELGIADFVLREPARVAAALPKCFYFQSDHWRAAVIQDDGSTKLYEWDGHYFFDKARADGGVWVTNFNINGRTGDPSAMPGMPSEYSRYFGPGTGGFITRNGMPGDPDCAARAAREPEAVYASRGGVATGAQACPDTSGIVTRRSIGPIRLGETETALRERLGPPARVHRGFLRYCVAAGGGELLVGQAEDRSGELGSDPDARAVMLLTTSASHRLKGAGPGSSARAFAKAFPRRRVRVVNGPTRVYETSRRSGVVMGVLRRRVAYLAVVDRRHARTAAALRALLRRAH